LRRKEDCQRRFCTVYGGPNGHRRDGSWTIAIAAPGSKFFLGSNPTTASARVRVSRRPHHLRSRHLPGAGRTTPR